MGIIILPFILIALIAFIISVVILFKSLLKKELNPKNFLIGTITSISIYFLIFMDYKTSESSYALGTYFMFPFFLILIPFTGGIILKIINKPKTIEISNSLFTSVILSGLFMVLFSKYTFGIIEYLGISKHY